jgi:ribosome-associated translation inhibitor RaiA
VIGDEDGGIAMVDFPVQVTTHGPVSRSAEDYAVEKILRLGRFADRDVLFAHVTLREETNPSIERQAVAKASLDVSGRIVQAHVAAESIDEAIDFLEERLRRRLEKVTELRGPSHETGEAVPGEWRHGALPRRRPSFFPRPPEEREVIAHKVYTLAALIPEEAVDEMEELDHDFYLFTDAETGEEAVVHRRDDGSLGLRQMTPVADRVERVAIPMVLDPMPAPTLTPEQATARLDATGELFVFYADAETGRGNVIYRRYDGHYGRIVPAD